MKLKWYGHSCFGMTFADGTTLITDPFDDTVGYPLCTARADAVLSSHDHFDHNHIQSVAGSPRLINTAGAHEVGSVHITGYSCFHDPEQGRLRGTNVVFVVEADGLRIAHLGDLGHMPDEALLAAISDVDVMLIPIGGFFTIDTAQAVEVIRQANPRAAVAMHFRNAHCGFTISDETEFIRLTGAVETPSELEITPETALPKAIVMRYE